MVSGIEITARYRIRCDYCGVYAEDDTEYGTFAEATAARTRVTRFDGWLLRWVGALATLTCPECAARPGNVGGSV